MFGNVSVSFDRIACPTGSPILSSSTSVLPPVIYHCYSTLVALLSPTSATSSTALPSTSNPSAVRTDVYTLPGLRKEEGEEEEAPQPPTSPSPQPSCPAQCRTLCIDQCTCNFELELKGERLRGFNRQNTFAPFFWKA